MARQGMLPNYLQRELPPDEAGAPGRRGGEGIRMLLLDAGRVLMLWGWGTLAATAVSSTENRQADAAGNAATAARAFLGLLLWLLGVSLVTFASAARRRFPRRGAAVTTNLVTGRFFPPWN
ncbi:hypothetical protein GQ55_4G048400 [Panicum hallii var. hallii]|uniref:Uncharacterized protein n=1 Tax=Panicum hallii var. hallii TaxID=1504633 RepID=A0A2T7DVC3_9POAL|nr:hypothetical protein GQ55_4G048400 [Panicum hallii var. hallii]